MDPRILREYRRLRAKGWNGSQALRDARVNVAWDDANSEELVMLRSEPDDMYEPPTYSDLRPSDRAKYEKADREAYERDGVWVWQSFYRVSEDGEWIQADSVGGCIGDFDDSGYDIDLKANALAELDEAIDPLVPIARGRLLKREAA